MGHDTGVLSRLCPSSDRAGDAGWAVPGARGFAGEAGGRSLGNTVSVITGQHGEVIPNLRPKSHQTHAADLSGGSFTPSQPGAISDSFSFPFPLAFVTLF